MSTFHSMRLSISIMDDVWFPIMGATHLTQDDISLCFFSRFGSCRPIVWTPPCYSSGKILLYWKLASPPCIFILFFLLVWYSHWILTENVDSMSWDGSVFFRDSKPFSGWWWWWWWWWWLWITINSLKLNLLTHTHTQAWWFDASVRWCWWWWWWWWCWQGHSWSAWLQAGTIKHEERTDWVVHIGRTTQDGRNREWVNERKGKNEWMDGNKKNEMVQSAALASAKLHWGTGKKEKN